MTTKSLRKMAFLDTNVLHFANLYLRQAKDGDLFPFGGDLAATSNELNTVTDKAATHRHYIVEGREAHEIGYYPA